MSVPIFESVLTLVEEAERPVKTKVVRGGKLKIKWVCKPGFKYNPSKKVCERMSVVEKKARQKAAKKMNKTKKKNKFNIAISSKKSRKISDRMRKSRGLD